MTKHWVTFYIEQRTWHLFFWPALIISVSLLLMLSMLTLCLFDSSEISGRGKCFILDWRGNSSVFTSWIWTPWQMASNRHKQIEPSCLLSDLTDISRNGFCAPSESVCLELNWNPDMTLLEKTNIIRLTESLIKRWEWIKIRNRRT